MNSPSSRRVGWKILTSLRIFGVSGVWTAQKQKFHMARCVYFELKLHKRYVQRAKTAHLLTAGCFAIFCCFRLTVKNCQTTPLKLYQVNIIIWCSHYVVPTTQYFFVESCHYHQQWQPYIFNYVGIFLTSFHLLWHTASQMILTLRCPRAPGLS